MLFVGGRDGAGEDFAVHRPDVDHPQAVPAVQTFDRQGSWIDCRGGHGLGAAEF